MIYFGVRCIIEALCHVEFRSDWCHLLILFLDELLALAFLFSRHHLFFLVDFLHLHFIVVFYVLCLLRVSIDDVSLNFLFFKLSDSLSNIVFLSTLEASLDDIHLLPLGLFDADQCSIHLILRQQVRGLAQVDRLLFQVKIAD